MTMENTDKDLLKEMQERRHCLQDNTCALTGNIHYLLTSLHNIWESDLISKADKLFVSFRFNWKDYSSWLVVTARNYDSDGKVSKSEEYATEVAPIPLIGGVWSNHVLMSMIQGQNYITWMLNAMYDHLVNYSKYCLDCTIEKKAEIIKVDRCFYAPFLHAEKDSSGEEYDGEDGYISFLKDNYPESYNQMLQLKTCSKYMNEYHDADLDADFSDASENGN